MYIEYRRGDAVDAIDRRTKSQRDNKTAIPVKFSAKSHCEKTKCLGRCRRKRELGIGTFLWWRTKRAETAAWVTR